MAFAPLYVIAAWLWFSVPNVRKGIGFFMLFALVATASVQMVGVYVVFASLILPALAVNTMHCGRTFGAIAVGIIAVIVGIVFSALGDMPTGPVLAFAFALAAIICRVTFAVFAKPRKIADL